MNVFWNVAEKKVSARQRLHFGVLPESTLLYAATASLFCIQYVTFCALKSVTKQHINLSIVSSLLHRNNTGWLSSHTMTSSHPHLTQLSTWVQRVACEISSWKSRASSLSAPASVNIAVSWMTCDSRVKKKVFDLKPGNNRVLQMTN